MTGRPAAPHLPSIRNVGEGRWRSLAGRWLGLPADDAKPRLPPRLVLLAGVVAGSAVVLYVAPRWGLGWGLAGALAVGFGLVRLAFLWERRRWRALLLAQVPDVIGLVCSTTRTGLPLAEAMRSVAREIPGPSREQFVRVTDELGIGQTLEAALWGVHARTGLAEYGFFAVTVGLQSQTGGSLLETLENLQEMVRRRVSVARRGKALAAEARTSALILELLPFVAGGMMELLNPGYFSFFLDTPGGNRLLLIAIGLFATGVLAIQTLIARSLSE